MTIQSAKGVRAVSAFAGLVLLASCGLLQDPGPNPQARPPDLDTTAPVAEPSEQSVELQKYYTRLQRSFQTRGLSRTDGGGFETPAWSR